MCLRTAAAIALLFFSSTVTGVPVQVETTLGWVEGEVLTLIDSYHDGFEVNTFYGIPFAKPPLGELRFTPPVYPDPWEGILDATIHGDWCVQLFDSDLQSAHPNQGSEEDCLNLNIVAPADSSDGPYPVMVYIHGGSYQGGSNLYEMGHFLAAQGVVFVIPNYRLGVFGFAYTGDGEIPGNMGLMDQIHALQFIQDNIAAFGGDPDLVTVFGQSAGGTSVGQLILSPWATGLFHQAIPQSGCDLSNWGVNQPNHNPEQYTFQVAEDVGCPIENTAEMTECLRSVPAATLNNANFDCAEGYFCMGMVPVVDGPGGVIPDIPYSMKARGEYNHVPEMIGLTRHDAFSSIPVLGPDVIFGPGPTWEEYQEIIQDLILFFHPRGIPDDRAKDLGKALEWYYAGWPHLDDRYNNRHQIGEMVTDGSYGYVADQQARLHSEYAPVYFYVFDYLSENTDWIEWMGCDHSAELPFVFGQPFLRHNPDVRDQTGIGDWYEWNEEDDEWSYFMMTLWTNFAKYGNPTPEPVPPPSGYDDVTWRNYVMGNHSYFHISRESLGTHEDYRQHQYAFFLEYMPYLVLRDEAPL